MQMVKSHSTRPLNIMNPILSNALIYQHIFLNKTKGSLGDIHCTALIFRALFTEYTIGEVEGEKLPLFLMYFLTEL